MIYWLKNLIVHIYYILFSFLVASCYAKPVTTSFQDSDGDKSDDLVVDVSNEVRRGLSYILEGCTETKHSSLLSVEATTVLSVLTKSLS